MTGRACRRTGSCTRAPAPLAQRSGLGTRLLRALAAQLRGSFARRPGEAGLGTVVELRFPVDAPGRGRSERLKKEGQGGGILPGPSSISLGWHLPRGECQAHKKEGWGSGREYFSLPPFLPVRPPARAAGTRRIAPPGVAPGTAAAMSAATSSFCQSTPVSTPMRRNIQTTSSIATLPVAPGAKGQPPIPPEAASKMRQPASRPATTLATPMP